MKQLITNLKKERGQSVVEFSIIISILLLMICAIIDFGWLFYNNISVNNCAREGARYAIVNTGTTGADQAIRDRILAVAPDGIKNNLGITIAYSNTQDPALGDVTVTVTAEIPVLTPVLGIFYQDQVVPVSSKTTMKME